MLKPLTPERLFAFHQFGKPMNPSLAYVKIHIKAVGFWDY
jgi:hypothetical protein